METFLGSDYCYIYGSLFDYTKVVKLFILA